jgi:hypothetical protein
MNADTLVTVHGYSGDAHQIRAALSVYEHHKCPVVIFSPADSKIEKMGPHICEGVGKRAYTGPESLVRQKLQMEAMLKYPFNWFLANDSDSMCLSPLIPQYLYKEPDVLWSNEVSDMMHNRPAGYKWPRLAFQPPYFMSRRVIEQLLTVADSVECEPQTPFIDWVMMAWAIASGCAHKNFHDGASYPTRNSPEGLHVMRGVVRNRGKVMVHSIKDARVLRWLVQDRTMYLRNGRVVNVNQKRRGR